MLITTNQILERSWIDHWISKPVSTWQSLIHCGISFRVNDMRMTTQRCHGFWRFCLSKATAKESFKSRDPVNLFTILENLTTSSQAGLSSSYLGWQKSSRDWPAWHNSWMLWNWRTHFLESRLMLTRKALMEITHGIWLMFFLKKLKLRRIQLQVSTRKKEVRFPTQLFNLNGSFELTLLFFSFFFLRKTVVSCATRLIRSWCRYDQHFLKLAYPLLNYISSRSAKIVHRNWIRCGNW